MDEKFCTKLEQVCELITAKPDWIVDDTALDRLLISLEQISKEQHQAFNEIIIKFLDNVESWQQPMTASFGLRLAGSVGYQLANVDEKMKLTVVKCIQSISNQADFMDDLSVKHGFYTCLKCLASDESWITQLEVYIDKCLQDFSATFLYIRKISSEFLATFLQTALHLNQEMRSMATVMSAAQDTSDNVFLESFMKSMVMIAESDFRNAIKFLNMTNFIERVVNVIKEAREKQSTLGLLDSLVDLFGALTSCIHFDGWESLLPCVTTNPHQLFIGLVESVRSNSALKQVMPKLCSSLLHKNPRERNLEWNKRMLQNIFLLVDKQLVLINHDDVVSNGDNEACVDKDEVKSWKTSLMTTIDVLSKINAKLYSGQGCCVNLFNNWFSYFFRVFEISLNQVEDKLLTERFLSLIHDKKMARLCFTYFKQIPYKALHDDLKTKYAKTLWNVLKCSSDSTQIMCLGLDVLCNFIQGNNISPLLPSVSQQNLANMLNMRMCDMNWEVRESLLTVLIVIFKECQKEHEDCESFLAENIFWCSLLQLVDDEESYVRSNAVSLLKEIISTPSLAVVFYQVQNTSLSEIWKEIEQKFTCFERQDDMFTRRSILELIRAWVECDVISIQSTDNELTKIHQIPMSKIQDILSNGVLDFDWETRRKCTDVIKAVIIATRKLSADKENTVQRLWSIFHGIVAKLACDCEYMVKLELVECLLELKTSMVDIATQITDKNGTSARIENLTQTIDVKTFEEFEHSVTITMREVKPAQLRHTLQGIDFGAVTKDLKEMDDIVRNNPCSFLEDIIASAQQTDGNLLDCY